MEGGERARERCECGPPMANARPTRTPLVRYMRYKSKATSFRCNTRGSIGVSLRALRPTVRARLLHVGAGRRASKVATAHVDVGGVPHGIFILFGFTARTHEADQRQWRGVS